METKEFKGFSELLDQVVESMDSNLIDLCLFFAKFIIFQHNFFRSLDAATSNNSQAAPKCAAKYEPQHTYRNRSAQGKHYSRYNFSKNLIKLAAARTQENSEGWMDHSKLCERIAEILDVTRETAREHVRRAIAMGLLDRDQQGKHIFVKLHKSQPVEINFLKDEEEPQDSTETDMDLPS